MSRSNPVIAAITALLALVCAGVRADEPKLDLRPRFTVGQENRFVVDMHSKTESRLLDKPQVKLEEYRQRIRVKRRVLEANEAGATLELRYEAVVVNLVAGNRTLYFDSEGMNGVEPEEAIGNSVRNAIERTFVVKVDSLGRFQSVSGNVQDGTKVAARNLIGDDLFERLFTPLYGPGKEPSSAAVGETWTTTRQSAPSQTGQFTTTVVSKLRGLASGGERAMIDISGSVALQPSEKARTAKAEVTSHLVTGEQAWNIVAGACDRSAYRQSMQVRAEVEVTSFETREAEIRTRQVDTLLHVVVNRIDDGVSALPPLEAPLAMPELMPPENLVIPPAAAPAPPPGH